MWTAERISEVKNRYATDGSVRLAAELGTSTAAVTGMARRLGIRKSGRRPLTKWTPERLAAMRERYAAVGPQVLAAEWGDIDSKAVIVQAGRMGISKKRERPYFDWTPDLDDELRRRYAVDGGAELAREWGMTEQAVYSRASDMGLHKGKTFNVKFFDEWSPNMAYMLGFIFADGNVYRCESHSTLSIGVNVKDEYILESFRTILESERVLYRIPAKSSKLVPNSGPSVVLAATSVDMVKTLIEVHGVHPGKSYRDDPMPNVPDEFFPHFARGFFDGDGSISQVKKNRQWRVALIGQPLFIEQIRDRICSASGVSKTSISIREGCVMTTWGRQSDILRLARWFYPPGTKLFLTRKRDRFFKAIEEIGEKVLSQNRGISL